MSRTTHFLFKFLAAVLCTSAASAIAALPNQPRETPANIIADDPTSDFGAFAVIDPTVVQPDPARALAYDDFTLTQGYEIDAICWSGIYAEPFPMVNPQSNTDFLVRIYEDDGSAGPGAPDLLSLAASWTLAGGLAGISGPDVNVTPLGYSSPITPFNPIGGGPAFDYDAMLTPTALGPGKYWISITALQDFATPPPAVDPEWMWHLATPGDGFYSYDALFPAGPVDIGVIVDRTDALAFQLKGTLIPEPSSMLLAMGGFLALGMIRRKRS